MMNLRTLNSDEQIVIDGQQPWPDRANEIHVSHYLEYMGGLGDVLHRLYTHNDYFRLFRMEPHQRAAVVLMSHNPGTVTLFENLPDEIASRTIILNLGFTTPFHPWENEEWRHANGLPRKSPCPGGLNHLPLSFFPGVGEARKIWNFMLDLSPYVVFSVTSGDLQRDIPPEIYRSMVLSLHKVGIRSVFVGHPKYERNTAAIQVPTLSLVGCSVPLTILAVRGSLGVVTSFSSMMLASWHERIPTFILYTPWVKENLVSRGAVGYTFGIDRPSTSHGLISEYTENEFVHWANRAKNGIP